MIPSTPVPTPDESCERYFNRELGLLSFQRRVLAEAKDRNNPILERVNFLSIVGSNLDEFFMVRVGGLVMQHRAQVPDLSIDGQTAAEQLVVIRKEAEAIMVEAMELWHGELQPELAANGIHVLEYKDLTDKQRSQLETRFVKSIFPALTPQAFDPGRPFPHISNLSLNLAARIKDENGEEHFARVKVPATLPRLVPLKRSSGGQRKDGTVPHAHWFVWLEQLIIAHLDLLFPGNELLPAFPFRVTRNADIELQEDEAADLLESMSENLHTRRFSPVIRLTLDQGMPKQSRHTLTQNLHVNNNDVYDLPGPLALNALSQLYSLERHDLKNRPTKPRTPSELKAENLDGNIFELIRAGDLLFHHPYESFDPVLEFLKTAVRDPEVVAIKQTLYRVGGDSPIVKLLLKARREYRKQVTVFVELKARFDEESNIGWARMLEREGVHVIYGMIGLKTHAKTLMVIRREGDELRRYVHLGTGNYNTSTAKIYEDVGMLTADQSIGEDLTDLFNYLTGRSNISNFRRLLVAPLNLRARFESMIQREIEHAQAGKEARLIFKCNALVDRKIIDLLYQASAAGVKIELLVRGMCSLLPGVPGMSENIRVRSVIGRFLEHSRIYYFHNDGDDQIYVGSADLMTRNVSHRVETLFPIEDEAHRDRLRSLLLDGYLADDIKSWHMQNDASYELMNAAGIDLQEKIIGQTKSRLG